jgi:hypothetical protein
MRYLIFIFTLLIIQGNVFAQSKWKNVDWKFRSTILSFGLGKASYPSHSANYFTNEYKKLNEGAFVEFNLVELLYMSHSKTIFFIRPSFFESIIDSMKIVREEKNIIDNYASLKGQQYYTVFTTDRGLGYTYTNLGVSFGVGKSYKVDPFMFEPFLGLNLSAIRPFDVKLLIKDKNRNYYLRESYKANNALSAGFLAGIKINIRLIGVCGLTIEPNYFLLPVFFKYKYTYSDTKNNSQEISKKDQMLISRLGLNVGMYLTFVKRKL